MPADLEELEEEGRTLPIGDNAVDAQTMHGQWRPHAMLLFVHATQGTTRMFCIPGFSHAHFQRVLLGQQWYPGLH
jgi:hypothetical protein